MPITHREGSKVWHSKNAERDEKEGVQMSGGSRGDLQASGGYESEYTRVAEGGAECSVNPRLRHRSRRSRSSQECNTTYKPGQAKDADAFEGVDRLVEHWRRVILSCHPQTASSLERERDDGEERRVYHDELRIHRG